MLTEIKPDAEIQILHTFSCIWNLDLRRKKTNIGHKHRRVGSCVVRGRERYRRGCSSGWGQADGGWLWTKYLMYEIVRMKPIILCGEHILTKNIKCILYIKSEHNLSSLMNIIWKKSFYLLHSYIFIKNKDNT